MGKIVESEVMEIEFTKVRKVFIFAVDKILWNDFDDLPIPFRKIKKTLDTMHEIIAGERTAFTDGDKVFQLPTSETEFLKTFVKYLPKSKEGNAPKFINPYLRKMNLEDGKTHYMTPSGNMIKFDYL